MGWFIRVGVPKNPWPSVVFGRVCHPIRMVLVVRKPLSSHPVVVSNSRVKEGDNEGEVESMVCHPIKTDFVVRKPLSSQPVVISNTGVEEGENESEDEGPNKESDVGSEVG